MNNFVNCKLFVAKLSGINPYEKRIDYPGGHAWGHVFVACSKLKQWPLPSKTGLWECDVICRYVKVTPWRINLGQK